MSASDRDHLSVQGCRLSALKWRSISSGHDNVPWNSNYKIQSNCSGISEYLVVGFFDDKPSVFCFEKERKSNEEENERRRK